MTDSTANPPRRRGYLGAFAAWFLALSFVMAACTGVYIYFTSSGADVVVAQRTLIFGLHKGRLLEVHVLFGFLLVAFGPIWGLWKLMGRSVENPRVRVARNAICGFAALVAVGFLAAKIADLHPALAQEVRTTPFPAQLEPDQVVLTWSEDPCTTQTFQWRTSPEVTDGEVRYRPIGAQDASWQTIEAEHEMFEDAYLANDFLNSRYTAVLEGLSPGTAYAYEVGSGGVWHSESTFHTAPEDSTPFTFIYMGDVQKGFETWASLMENVHEKYPAAAFYCLAGDLVDSGISRNQWDELFHYGADAFATAPLMPAIGNHDDSLDGNVNTYTSLLDLPKNGPEKMTPERAYYFNYGNALVVILDSNLYPSTQTDWLEKVLSESDAEWKFAMFHHPLYSSKPERDNPQLRKTWGPLFEKYGVDMVLQGHDHAYLRTYPLIGGERVAPGQGGVTYVVSAAGTKFYDQDEHDYTAVGLTKTATYQAIHIDGPTLTYRAHAADGAVVDEFTLQKAEALAAQQ